MSKTSFLAKNVQINPELVRNVRFVQRELPSGETFVWVRAKGLPKLIIRQNGREVIGHLPGERATPKVTATSPRAAFLKMVDAVWNAKPSKNSWHPKAA